jgi:hypothetical protein
MPRPTWTQEQARIMGKRGGAASKLQRRARMWTKYQAMAAGMGRFEAFLAGWDAHRKWSAVRRWQRKEAQARVTA